ncbi:hypothetical protein KAR91_64025 [Candidatus Pacearchaeota archaeon]|nr:hypothetical protein [Candidatus Pacearchaeota archaeon]
MEIKIKETGEIESLGIVDPKTGVNWINDLMGNHNALPDNDDVTGYYSMSQTDFDWWDDLVSRLSAAEDQYNNLLNYIDDKNYENLQSDYESINCDLEDRPQLIIDVCKQY